MRQIKFKARTRDGKCVSGDLLTKSYAGSYWRIRAGFAEWYEVDPEAVVQLVGVDKNGVEVYEGDWVQDEFGNRIRAELITLPIEKMEVCDVQGEGEPDTVIAGESSGVD